MPRQELIGSVGPITVAHDPASNRVVMSAFYAPTSSITPDPHRVLTETEAYGLAALLVAGAEIVRRTSPPRGAIR